jgi:UDP-N-acetylglucosamine 2-epimerase
MTVVGARPQFIKAAALSRAITKARATGIECDELIVHTGQHYDANMSDVFFDGLGIAPPRVRLDVGSESHGEQTGEMMRRLEPCVLEHAPDAVVLYGDTNSTLAGALVAAKLMVPVVHVEAGLRSFKRSMPEETNRVVTDHVSNLLLCPSAASERNLLAEGIVDGVHVVGDLMLDVLMYERARLGDGNPRFDALGLGDEPKVLVTLHRPSNVDSPARLAQITDAIACLARRGFEVVWPVHPRVAQSLGSVDIAGVHLITPLSYSEMLAALRDSVAVVTDSGGLQKEALWMARPCFTLRSETEWVETVESGWNVLVGERPQDLPDEVESAMARAWGQPPQPYGHGDAADRSLQLILELPL